MKKSFKKEDVSNAIEEDTIDGDSLEFYTDEPWIDDGKYQYKDYILKDSDGKLWIYTLSRSGSYFSDYEYGIQYESSMIELTEVYLSEKIIKVWKPVKDNTNGST